MPLNVFGCSVSLPSAVVLPQLAPVIINENTAVVPAGDEGTDTLLITHGAGVGSQEGTFLMTSGTAGGDEVSYTLGGTHTIRVNDLVVASPSNPHGANCQTTPLVMGRITAVNAPANMVTVDRGLQVAGGVMYNLGQRPGTANVGADQVPSSRAYRVRNSTLVECDLMTRNCTQEENWAAIAPDIVGLRAEYRLSDGTYTRVVPVTANRSCGYARIQGIRLALVARSPQKAKMDVTTAATLPRWSGQTQIEVTHLPDWNFYRYTTFETLIAIRNVNWMGVLDAAFCP